MSSYGVGKESALAQVDLLARKRQRRPSKDALDSRAAFSGGRSE